MKIITKAIREANPGIITVSTVERELHKIANSVPLWQTGFEGVSLSPFMTKFEFAKEPSNPYAQDLDGEIIPEHPAKIGTPKAAVFTHNQYH